MTITTLFFIEGIVIGAVISSVILFFLWASDLRDRDRKAEVMKDEAYDKGYMDGYEAGGRFRFRERCQIAREFRQIRKDIQELENESQV